MKVINFEDVYTIKIGSNAEENHALVESMEPNDSWFHLDEYPSPHLVINTDYDNLSKKMIYQIALLLKQNTKYKKEAELSILYTHRKNLITTKIPGTVTIKGKYESIKI
jgi:predicted ribosome quality control (RQC) complex YloA/Tae2 family protein